MPLSQDAIDRASAEVFRRWLRFIPEAEARAQADQFARRAASLGREGHLTETELDTVLSVIATEMAEDA